MRSTSRRKGALGEVDLVELLMDCRGERDAGQMLDLGFRLAEKKP
jgi:hypothetical protein